MQKNQLLNKLNNLKKNIPLNTKDLKDLQTNFLNGLMNAQKELHRIIELGPLKSKISNEKKQVEEVVEKLLIGEMNKLKSFVLKHKNDMHDMQEKIESYIQKLTKLAPKKVVKKVVKKAPSTPKKAPASKPEHNTFKSTSRSALKKSKSDFEKVTTNQAPSKHQPLRHRARVRSSKTSSQH